MHKVDKLGRPTYYDRIGFTDFSELFKITTPERLINKGLVHTYET